MNILDAGSALRARKVSSQKLVRDALARITAHNLDLNAFIAVTEASARLAAENADAEIAAGHDRGPLHGIPIALKDLIHVAGVPTTAGSKVLRDSVPDRDAEVVRRLKHAGAVIVGKTNMHEIAYGITSNNPHYGPVRNPRDPRRIAGGSSGGSAAAVADGMALAALGTDTGGSIRIPASFCGVVGYKPSYTLVSREGVVPLGWTLDHVGPLASTVRDCAVVTAAIAGLPPDFVPPEDASLRGVRIGLPENFYFECVWPEVAEAVRNAARKAESAGAVMVPVTVPDIEATNAIARVILLAEAAAAWKPWRAHRDDFGADVVTLLDQGRLIPATDYINAQRMRRQCRAEFARIWKQVDCLFTPTTPTTAPRIGEHDLKIDDRMQDVRIASTRFVRGINLLGIPAVSLPCGLGTAGLPIGLQILSGGGQDQKLLRIAAALETILD
ncbi:MAG TPA: amidase [Bryobacteraceae bacterium]|nr:amidase [Bryobacteraceae bacterium]